MKPTGKRIIFGLILLGTVFYMPWWIVIVLVFVGTFCWPPFYEIFAFGILMDLLYGSNTFSFGGITGFLSATVIFFLVTYARKMVR